MQNRRKTQQTVPQRGTLSCVCFFALFSLLFCTSVHAQSVEKGIPEEHEYNKDVRTKSWSIYAEGGLSWATGLWYSNEDAKPSYNQSPAVGGGIDYTIRPWVRVGVEYLWSRYRREQRMSSLAGNTMPLKAYGNYLMNYHKIKFGGDFNVLELWPRRKSQWLNIWFGTGVGYLMSTGNEYGIYFSTTTTQNGTSTPSTGNINVSNNSSVQIEGNVRTTNTHASYEKFYIPASLHVEFDVARELTLGLKGEIDWLLNRKDIAPKNLSFGLVTLRYNFVPSKAKKIQQHYDNRLAEMDALAKDALRQAESEKARAAQVESERQRLARENADLQRQLRDCEQREVVVEKPTYTVKFGHNSSYFSKKEGEALKAFVQQYKGKKLSLVAEASKQGDKGYNQALSERRLMRVIKALQKVGFAEEDLKPSIAIGAQRGIDSAEARRVTITVE